MSMYVNVYININICIYIYVCVYMQGVVVTRREVERVERRGLRVRLDQEVEAWFGV